jgi:hypothetical protein
MLSLLADKNDSPDGFEVGSGVSNCRRLLHLKFQKSNTCAFGLRFCAHFVPLGDRVSTNKTGMIKL